MKKNEANNPKKTSKGTGILSAEQDVGSCEGCGEPCKEGLCRACYEQDLWNSYMSMVYGG